MARRSSADANGPAVLDLLRRGWHGAGVILCAFDLLELDGKEIAPSADRGPQTGPGEPAAPAARSIAFNEHYTGDGAIIYKHACALGCEGIVSKRLGSPHQAGRSAHWLKVKNPGAPAVKRGAEEEWR